MSVKKQQRIVLWAGNWKEKNTLFQGQLFFICEGAGSSFNEQSFFKSPCNVFWQNNTENVPDL